MANYTLTTSAQEVGSNLSVTVGCRLLAWYTDASTTGATAHLKLQAKSQGTTYTGTNKDYELNLGDVHTGTVAWPYTPLNADTWYDVAEVTKWMGSGTTAECSGKVWTYVFDDAWITGVYVTMPTFASAPTGLAAGAITRGSDSFTSTISVTSWGGTGSASTRGLELQCWTYDPSTFVMPRRYQVVYGDNLSAEITVNNSSSGELMITPNTMYTLGMYASNGTYNTGNQRIGNYTTLAAAPTVTVSSTTASSATLAYSLSADGGKYSKDLEYSMDSGTTWNTAATVSTGAATTGTFTLTGLTPETAYTVQTRVTTAAGTTTGPTVTFVTDAKTKIYGSVNGETKRIKKIYCSLNGETREVTKMYGSVNGLTKRIF